MDETASKVSVTTPPWHIWAYEIEDEDGRYPAFAVFDAEGRPIANEILVLSLANQIAALPDLLAALIGLDGLLADVANEPELDSEHLVAINAARAAIAKAEGRPSA